MVSGEFASDAPESRLGTQSHESHVVASTCVPSCKHGREMRERVEGHSGLRSKW